MQNFSELLILLAAASCCCAAEAVNSTTESLRSSTSSVGTSSEVLPTEDTTPWQYSTENTSGEPVTTEASVWGSKPDCNKNPDRQFYPHTDCNKYWWCVSGEALLFLCSPGTFFNPAGNFCDFPENVDTSHCRVWVCEADGDVFAGAACNEFYECEHGQAVSMICAEGLYFNPILERCDLPTNVDVSTCNEP